MKSKTELLADIDRVTAERDAALAEIKRYQSLFNQAQKAIDRLNELHPKRIAEIGRRLTAADVLEGLLRDALPSLDLAADAFKSAKTIRNKVRAALKPAVGGGDESAHDRAYRNGLMQGYNLALNGSEKEYQEAVARYSGGKDAE